MPCRKLTPESAFCRETPLRRGFFCVQNQAVLSVGYRNEQGLAADLRTNWYDSTCSFATCNTYEKIDSYYTVDLATRYALDKQTEVYLNLLNLTDNATI